MKFFIFILFSFFSLTAFAIPTICVDAYAYSKKSEELLLKSDLETIDAINFRRSLGFKLRFQSSSLTGNQVSERAPDTLNIKDVSEIVRTNAIQGKTDINQKLRWLEACIATGCQTKILVFRGQDSFEATKLILSGISYYTTASVTRSTLNVALAASSVTTAGILFNTLRRTGNQSVEVNGFLKEISSRKKVLDEGNVEAEEAIYRRLYLRMNDNQQLFIAYIELINKGVVTPHLVFARRNVDTKTSDQ